MYVKKFYANSMPEAMAAIRAELGADAIILQSQKKRHPGLLGFFRPPRLEVTAAVDKDLRDFPQPTRAVTGEVRQMRRELADLKLALAQVSKSSETQSVTQSLRQQTGQYTLPPRVASLDGWYRRLLEQGVATELAQQIIQTVADELSRWALDNENVLNEHLHWHLGRRLKIPRPITLKPGTPQVLFLVGPTGVGKTTTVAKLAANFKRNQKARVLMITADTFRVAAIPQFHAFGEILEIPTAVVYTPTELAELVHKSTQYDLILVDTPGRNQRSPDEVGEVADFLAAVPHKTVFLTIAAGTQIQDMRQIADAFGSMKIDSLIFTKTDETVSFGPAYSLACITQTPLSYLTTGQRVPDDIEVASAERVIDLLVGDVPDEIRSTRRFLAEQNGNSRYYSSPQEAVR